MMYLCSLPAMHFLFYLPLIDVLSLLHSFVFALHISRIPPPSLVTRPWVLRQNAHRPLEAEYTPSCCRPIISSRTLPTPSTRLHLHTNATPPTTPFVLFIPACFFIYSSRYIVSSPFCRPSWGTPMRGRGPPGYLALSSCTSFDIDVTLFANTLALNRLSRCPSWLKGRESVWVRGGSAKVVG